MAIDLPPTAPNRTQPTTFSARMDDFLAWLVTAVPQFNALALATGPGSFLDGSAAAPGITFGSDTDTGIWRPQANVMAFANNGAESGRLTALGNLLLGSANNVTGIGFAKISTQSTNGQWAHAHFNSGSVNGPILSFARSRAATVDTYTIVNANDQLGNVEFMGADGTTMVLSARIRSQASGTPAAGDVRGNLTFWTGSGAGAVANRLTIGETTIDATLPVTSTGPISSGFTALSAGTLAMAFATAPNKSVTPNATGTLTTTVPRAGTVCTLIINTSGTTSYTMTFGSGFKSQGTLATGTVTAKTFVLSFISDGTTCNEISRTAAM